jgi:hypothetical protein
MLSLIVNYLNTKILELLLISIDSYRMLLRSTFLLYLLQL